MHLDSSAPNYSGVLRNVIGRQNYSMDREEDTAQKVLLESTDLHIAMPDVDQPPRLGNESCTTSPLVPG